MNSDVKYKSRIPNTNQLWKNIPTQNSRINASFLYGFGLNVIVRIELLANYQYVQNPFNNNRIRSDYLGKVILLGSFGKAKNNIYLELVLVYKAIMEQKNRKLVILIDLTVLFNVIFAK